ncbi:MAG TPA: hypothetical protein VMW24_16755 [Sedimentisphaerales bacterium]|nr:hypothetical protein [Sedimentisphaerales bacterium]
MSILTANLRHFYQRRGLWLFYAFFGFLIFASIQTVAANRKAGQGRFVPFAILMFVLTGLTAASMQIEILNKPFAYCLPGHRRVARYFMLLIGILLSLLYSLLFLEYPGLDSWQLPLVVLSALFTFLTLYWFGAGMLFLTHGQAHWAVNLALWILFVGAFFKLHIVIENMITKWPLISVVSGILSSIIAWVSLGDERIARRYCDKPLFAFFGLVNRNSQRKWDRARIAAKGDREFRINPRVEEFFLLRLRRSKCASVGKYIWGSLYLVFALPLSQGRLWLFWILCILVTLCLLCYASGGGTIILFLIPGLMAIHLRLPVYSTLLISGGRKERFFSTMVLVITITVLVTAVAATIAAVTIPMASIMPEIPLRGINVSFHAVRLQQLFIPLLILPIAFTLNLVLQRKAIFGMLSVILSSMLLSTVIMNSVFLTIMIVFCWITFVGVLNHICSKSPLVGRG